MQSWSGKDQKYVLPYQEMIKICRSNYQRLSKIAQSIIEKLSHLPNLMDSGILNSDCFGYANQDFKQS